MISSVQLRVVSKCCLLLRADVALIFVLRFFPSLAFSSVNSGSPSLHSADDNCILEKLEFVGDRIVEENQEFCMEGEYVLDELAESFMVGNHKF